MNDLKETLIALLKVLAVFFVMAAITIFAMYIQGRYRLWIIQATVDSSIPGWLKMVLWGWM